MQSLLQQYSLEKDISQFNKTNVAIMDWYSLTHSLTHSLTRLLTHSLTHSLIGKLMKFS